MERYKIFSELRRPLLTLLLLTLLFLSIHYIWLTEVPSPHESKVVIIPQNRTAKGIGKILKENGVIKSSILFILATKLYGIDKRIRGGKYLLPKNISEFLACRILKKGGKEKVMVTIPEGWTMRQIAEILEREGVTRADSFIEACEDREFLMSLGIPFPKAEGFLFPNTYEFYIPSSPCAVIEKMVNHFFDVYRGLRESIPSPLSDSVVIILASLVEKEAVEDIERPMIAQVFLNRLRRGMKLEACPTVEYALARHKERLNSIDLEVDSPYNTYLYYGLPPTPISNPGKKSLAAVLSPAKTDYQFFFALKNGRHIFSKTFKEHQKRLEEYRRGE